MAHLSLARKYRPATFSEMLGQDGVVTALTNAIRLNRKPHSVIFAGVRGVGKTTVARLYAKALNCTGKSPVPCQTCESCVAIANGTHEDVLEIDGASHTGVDDVRAIQEAMGYVPQRSSYKIYIIDEVHMLSQSAFNALLKTLEEPPPHVVFLFATTELRKIPATILSRCQTYHLRLIPPAIIVERLATILKAENVAYEPQVLELVAREGKGSMRDSLTILDQAIALTQGALTVENVQSLFATASSTSFIQFLGALVQRDAPRALEVIAKWDESGVPLKEAIEHCCQFARHGFVVKDLGIQALDTAFLGLAKSELEELIQVSGGAADFDLNRIFRTLLKCRQDLDGSALDRFVVENYAMEWCLDPGFPQLDEILRGGKVVSSPLGFDGTHAKPSAPAGERRAKDLRAAFHETVQNSQKDKTQEPSGEAEASPNALRQLAEQYVAGDVHEEVKSAVEPSPAPTNLMRPFPSSWRELVDEWRKLKPLQARIWEEARVIHFDETRIELAVDPKSLVGAKLIQKDVQHKLQSAFGELFGFKGVFSISHGAAAVEGEETLLETRKRERDEARQKLKEELINHPVTQATLSAFQGKPASVEFQ